MPTLEPRAANYVLTKTREIVTLHRNPTAACAQLDDRLLGLKPNEFEAEKLLLSQQAVPCPECVGEKWG